MKILKTYLQDKKMKSFALKAFLTLFLSIFLFFPDYASACNPDRYAKNYIKKINSVLGGKRPSLIIEENNNDEIVGYFNDETGIHIYREDYSGSCKKKLPYLKSVIAHEYAHYAIKKLNKITTLKGEEKMAYVAEHAIGDSIFDGNVEYDNDLKQKYWKQYNDIFDYLENLK